MSRGYPVKTPGRVAEAQRLRAEGKTLAQIGREFGVTKSCVIRWLNPEGTRRQNAASNAKRGPAKRAWANKHTRGVCPCGTVLCVGSSNGSVKVCAECWGEIARVGRAMRMQPVHEMWHAGLSLRLIAAAMDMSVATVGMHVSRMRLEGWDMPYRHPGAHTREGTSCR